MYCIRRQFDTSVRPYCNGNQWMQRRDSCTHKTESIRRAYLHTSLYPQARSGKRQNMVVFSYPRALNDEEIDPACAMKPGDETEFLQGIKNIATTSSTNFGIGGRLCQQLLEDTESSLQTTIKTDE